MIKKINEYLILIINKLYSNKSTEKLKKKVLHTILKNLDKQMVKTLLQNYFVYLKVKSLYRL